MKKNLKIKTRQGFTDTKKFTVDDTYFLYMVVKHLNISDESLDSVLDEYDITAKDFREIVDIASEMCVRPSNLNEVER